MSELRKDTDDVPEIVRAAEEKAARLERAQEVFRQDGDINPLIEYWKAELAIVQVRAISTFNAEEFRRDLAKKNPSHPEHRLREIEDDARALHEKWVAKWRSEAADINSTIGDLYILAGEREKAKLTYDIAIELDPTNESVRHHIAVQTTIFGL